MSRNAAAQMAAWLRFANPSTTIAWQTLCPAGRRRRGRTPPRARSASVISAPDASRGPDPGHARCCCNSLQNTRAGRMASFRHRTLAASQKPSQAGRRLALVAVKTPQLIQRLIKVAPGRRVVGRARLQDRLHQLGAVSAQANMRRQGVNQIGARRGIGASPGMVHKIPIPICAGLNQIVGYGCVQAVPESVQPGDRLAGRSPRSCAFLGVAPV